ncbi:MAG: hypothetical protein RJB66_2509 [Pseudomonadota bacterium]
MYYSIVFTIAINLVHCTEPVKSQPPKIDKYKEDTFLMLNIIRKFVGETDANKLHKVAVATQQTRVIACADYNGECSYYGETLGAIIEASSDGVMTPLERKDLETRSEKLRLLIDEGLRKLKNE